MQSPCLEAAGYNEDLGRKTWIQSQLQQQLWHGPCPILEPDNNGSPVIQQERVPAVLATDWQGMRKGDRVTVTSHLVERGVIEVVKSEGAVVNDMYVKGKLCMPPPDI